VKTNKVFCAAAFGLVLACGAATNSVRVFAAEPLPANFVPHDQRNAAIRYLIAMIHLTPDRSEKLKAVDWTKLGTTSDPAKMTAEFNEAAKLDNEGLLRWTIDGTTMASCNFESNYEAGIGALLPQLGNMRQLARALRLDARINLLNGNADLGAQRVIEMIRLGSHLKQDSWLISVLVGAAIDRAAFAETLAVAESPKLSEAKRQELLAELRALNTTDPIHFRRAIAAERGSIVTWLKKESVAPGVWGRLKPQLINEGDPGWDTTLSDDEVRKQIGQLGEAYDAFTHAVTGGATDEEAKKFHEKAQSGTWGTLAAIMMPSVKNMRESERKYRVDLLNAIAALEKASKK